jgi:hypothetical protein
MYLFLAIVFVVFELLGFLWWYRNSDDGAAALAGIHFLGFILLVMLEPIYSMPVVVMLFVWGVMLFVPSPRVKAA